LPDACLLESIAVDLYAVERCLIQAGSDPEAAKRVSAHVARLLRQWLRLPEHVHRYALQIRHACVTHGLIYAASLCTLLQTRYSLHQQAIWRRRIACMVPVLPYSRQLQDGCVVYGAGAVGRLLASRLQSQGVPLRGWLDAYSNSTLVDDLPMFRPESTSSDMKSLPVVLSLSDEDGRLRDRLSACGYRLIISRKDLVGYA